MARTWDLTKKLVQDVEPTTAPVQSAPEKLLTSQTAAEKQANLEQLAKATGNQDYLTPSTNQFGQMKYTAENPMTPVRSTILETPTTPTPANPMVPVSSTGIKTTPAATTPINIYNTTPTQSGSNLIAPDVAAGTTGYNPMAQITQASEMYTPVYQDVQDRIAAETKAREEQYAKLKAEADAKAIEKTKQLEARYGTSIADIERQGQSAIEAAQRNLAFSGVGRSTTAADIIADLGRSTQAQVADLQFQKQNAIETMKADLVSSIDEQLKPFDEQLKSLRTEEASVRSEELKMKGDLMKEIIKNDPTNPTNQLKLANDLADLNYKNIQIDSATKKAVKDEALLVMENAIKYGYDPTSLSEEQVNNISANLGIPASEIHNVINSKIARDQEEKTKYQMSSDGMGGMYIFDPTSGRAVGKYDAYGNYSSLDGSAPPIVPNTNNVDINAKNVASTILGGRITQKFGVKVNYEKGGLHNGLDYVPVGGKGAPVQSFAGGTVIAVEKYNGNKTAMPYGNSVIVRTPDGKEIRYSHLDNINVVKGQQIQAGDSVGGLGTTGNSTGLHVDLRIKENGKYINPETYLKGLKNTQVSTSSNIPTTGKITQAEAEAKAGELGLYLAKDVVPFVQFALRTGQYPKSQGEIARLAAIETEKTKPLTLDQSNAALFGARLKQSEDVFNKLENQGFDFSKNQYITERAAPTSIWGVSTGGFGKSDEIKQQEQAERNFINAILRRESGAAISPTEFESAATQYFPQPGDTQDVLAQKKANRQAAIQGFSIAAGAGEARMNERMGTTSIASDTSKEILVMDKNGQLGYIPENEFDSNLYTKQ